MAYIKTPKTATAWTLPRAVIDRSLVLLTFKLNALQQVQLFFLFQQSPCMIHRIHIITTPSSLLCSAVGLQPLAL